MRSSQAVAAAVLGTVLCGGWALAATKPGRDNPPPPNRPFFPPANTAADHPRPAAPPRQWSPAAAARIRAGRESRVRGLASRPQPRPQLLWLTPASTCFTSTPTTASIIRTAITAIGRRWMRMGWGPPCKTRRGMRAWTGPCSRGPTACAAADEPRRAGPLERKARAERVNHARQDELAAKHIDYGDTLFAKQKYAEANDCYRQAAHNAPQLATAWFRQGLALAALGHCDSAADKIKAD